MKVNMKQILKHMVFFDKRFYLLILLNVLLYACSILIHSDFNWEYSSMCALRGLGFNIGFMGLIWFILSFIKSKRVYNITINSLVAFCLFLMCIELFLLMQFGFLLNATLMDIFLSTNPNEAWEFLDFYINANLFDGSKSSFFPYIIAFFVLISLIFLRLRLAGFSIASAFVFIASGLCFAFNVGTYKNSNSLYRLIISFQAAKTQSAHIVASHKRFLESKKDSINAMKKQNMGGGGGVSPTIVLIIGESTQRNYMGIYGLQLDTTPNLSKLASTNNLFVFTDIISPAANTNLVLSTLLTMSNYENASTPWYEQFNIVDLLKATGYYTTWISNQSGFSIHESSGTSIANSTDKQQFTIKALYDEAVLPLLDSVKEQNTESKQAYIIHLMGTHSNYKSRYPANFSKFSAADIDLIQKRYMPTEMEKEIKADYLNAIFYNDFVVSSIIDRFKDENAIIFYISDHAEEVYDIKSFAGRSFGGAPFMFEIPFVIYASDKFIESNLDSINRIKQALNKPQMSDDFIHSFFDILNLKVEGLDLTRSIFSNDYNDKRKRIVYETDYDDKLKISY